MDDEEPEGIELVLLVVFCLGIVVVFMCSVIGGPMF